ncbi:MAG TPA: UDP-N-acetylmuramoyl-tripeptide--D-alanyl-D-alanine ligase [Terriglobia bacterium]|nr:UDP-N-acetylmuramoyl-tripeptide--D-alanyl-D-alanine ligase [Terriglobia bacterium]
MRMSMGEVAGILDTSTGDPDAIALGYSIDSRTVKPGQLFFAIQGPRFNGHEFVAQALQRGAVGAIVEKGFSGLAPGAVTANLIQVSNPTDALQRLALEVRRKWGRRLVAITGSAGKTTTKEMVAAMLGQRFPVLKSPGNLNNDYGLPLALLQLEPHHEAAVMELAMSAPGEIARLARIAEPQVGVVTNVAAVHLQFFDSVDSIGRAKRELIESLPDDGTAVLNFDDRRVRGFAEGFPGRVVTYGLEPGAIFRASDIRLAGEEGSQFRVEGPGMKGEYRVPLPGRHNVQNALAAMATASLFDIPSAAIAEALNQFQTLHQRSEILTLPGDITILNDSYNSNPLAMEKMLETLAAWSGSKRRIVVAGEMLELGPSSPELHKQVGRRCFDIGVDWVLAVQGDARFLLEGALEAGLAPDHGRFFPSAQEAGNYCANLLRGGDVVLVKGSRGVHLEKVIELLQSHKEMLSPNKRGGVKG